MDEDQRCRDESIDAVRIAVLRKQIAQLDQNLIDETSAYAVAIAQARQECDVLRRTLQRMAEELRSCDEMIATLRTQLGQYTKHEIEAALRWAHG
jgi:hypothetical protein